MLHNPENTKPKKQGRYYRENLEKNGVFGDLNINDEDTTNAPGLPPPGRILFNDRTPHSSLFVH
jgi:hypothetical protein